MGPVKDHEEFVEPDEMKEPEVREINTDIEDVKEPEVLEIITDIEDFAEGFIPIGRSTPSHEIVEDADPSSPIVSAPAIVTDGTIKPRLLRQNAMQIELL